MELLRKVKNKIGSFSGFGACSKCGDTWDRTEHTVIPYSNKIGDHGTPIDYQSWNSGMFPLCKKCFDLSDENQVLQHCILLLNKWKKENKEQIIEVLKYNIHVMKG